MPSVSPTLLVLAAGMGSRFGGLKQVEPFGPSGETILEYSVHDAVQAGFKRVVFVIRRDFAQQFQDEVASRFTDMVQVDYAYQELDAVPATFRRNLERKKPWGTGHAVLVARQVVTTPFAVINADDFYGPSSFLMLAEELRAMNDNLWPPQYLLVAYQLDRTLSEHGSVSRGVCEINEKGFLERIEEKEKIRRGADAPETLALGGIWNSLPANTPVSMNMMGFSPSIFPFLEEQFREFLDKRGEELTSEFYLPEAVATLIRRNQARIKVIQSKEDWMGVTYPEDKESVRQTLKRWVEQGRYESPLIATHLM